MGKVSWYKLFLFLFLQSCVFHNEHNYDKALHNAIDSLELKMLSSEKLDFQDIETFEHLKTSLGKRYDAIPYYILKAENDNDTKSCYKVYELSKDVPYKQKQMQLLGIKYLKRGAMLQDSACINELNRIVYDEEK